MRELGALQENTITCEAVQFCSYALHLPIGLEIGPLILLHLCPVLDVTVLCDYKMALLLLPVSTLDWSHSWEKVRRV